MASPFKMAVLLHFLHLPARPVPAPLTGLAPHSGSICGMMYTGVPPPMIRPMSTDLWALRGMAIFCPPWDVVMTITWLPQVDPFTKKCV